MAGIFNELRFWCLTLVMVALGAAAQAQPGFSKVFDPDTIGPGSATKLIFTIDNTGGGTVEDLAFTDTLPAGMTVAEAPPVLTCPAGTVTAIPGSTSITLAEGDLAADSSCEITVQVTSSTVGTSTNTSGDLTSSAGNSGTATDDLEVDATLPGFTKSFAPDEITLGATSTLSFLIDNTAGGNIQNLDFIDNLPAGIVVADPANATTDCISGLNDTTLTATPGSGVITLDANGIIVGPTVLPVLSAGATCGVLVDVTGTAVGDHVNSAELEADFTSAGSATAALEVTGVDPGEILISKAFTDDPAVPGGLVTLEFTLTNTDRDFPASGVAFTDDLAAMLAGTLYDSLLFNDCGGSVAGLGTSTISFSGGTLTAGTAGGTCTIRTSLTIDSGASPGSFTNTTGAVTGTINGIGVTGNMASNTLTVLGANPLTFTKSFLTDPVGAGSPTVLRFFIENTNTGGGGDLAASDIEFTDNLTAFLPATVGIATPAPGAACGGTMSVGTGLGDERILELTGGALGEGASCTIDVTLTIPTNATAGTFTNTTSPLSALIAPVGTVQSPAATKNLTIVGGTSLLFSKEFIDDPVTAGTTGTLRFTLENQASSPGDATGLTFTDDLAAMLAGTTGVGLPIANPCGNGTGTVAGSAGDTVLTLSGLTLSPGENCTIDVTFLVDSGAASGTFPNTTDDLAGTMSGVAVTATAASDTLTVEAVNGAPVQLTKEFIDDPALPGQTVTARFTLTNPNTDPGGEATGIFFTDSFSSMGLGLTAPDIGPLTGNTCDVTPTVGTFLIFVGGTLGLGASCTFDIPITVPTAAAAGDYLNQTSAVTATIGAATVTGSQARDTLVVQGDPLFFTKSFPAEPVAPGDSVVLTFTIENTSTQDATNIEFSDDLDAMLSGAEATSAVSNGCGGMAAGFPVPTFNYTTGSLLAGATCTIEINVSVPASAGFGVYPNTTSTIEADFGASVDIQSPAASDNLEVTTIGTDFSKVFTYPNADVGAIPGGTATLTFTITNPNGVTVSDLGFTDQIDAELAGLEATSLPSDPCGTGSAITGTTLLTFTNGQVGPTGGTCSFEVEVTIPAAATAGSYGNTTSDLSSAGLFSSSPATDNLVVYIPDPLVFAKSFDTNPADQGQTVGLTITIDNTNAIADATGVAFDDDFGAGTLELATAPMATGDCGTPTLTGTVGGTAIGFSGGAIPAGGTCTIAMDVLVLASSNVVNTTTNQTSSLGVSLAASDTLTVNAAVPLVFDKSFDTNPADQGQTVGLTITIDNTNAFLEATGAAFDDDFGAGTLELATAPMATGDCGTPTLTGTVGGTAMGFSGGTIPVGGTCTVTMDVLVLASSNVANTTTNQTSSLGASTAATDTLTVNAAVPLVFDKSFDTNPADQGQTVGLTITIDNTNSFLEATGAAFDDDFGAGTLELATVPLATGDCGTPTLTGTVGGTAMGFSGGTIPVGGTCTVTMDVLVLASTSVVNTTTNQTSSLGVSLAASDTLAVNGATAPVFTKLFTPDVIDQGDTTVLTFTIDNSANLVEATGLGFTDPLLSGVIVAATPGASNGCNGTFTATALDDEVVLTGGSVLAGETCEISVTLQSPESGTFNNETSVLASSFGDGLTATDTLTTNANPLDLGVAFAPPAIEQFQTSTVTYTFTNNAAIDATSITLSDTLPGGVTIASPEVKSKTCTGGMVSAPAGGSAIDYAGGELAAGASCTVSVDVTASVVGAYLNAVDSATSSLGTSGAASATLTVDPATTGTVTFVQNTDEDGDYVFSSAEPALNFTIATAGGTGSQGPITLTTGSYAISQSPPEGVGNTAITCDDGDSTGDPVARTIALTLAPLENVTCTITSISTLQKTVDTINRFLTKRADLILSSEPRPGRRFDRLNRGFGNATRLSFAPGDLKAMLPFTAQISRGSGDYRFSTSLQQMRESAAAVQMAHDGTQDSLYVDNYRFDAWFEAQYKEFDSGADGEGHFAVAYVGVDYLMSNDVLIGALLQIDDMEDRSATFNSTARGTGWMIGPYMTARLAPNLYFDGRIAAGQSYNEVSPFNTYTDSFTTNRWMAMATLTGEFQRGPWAIRPAASLAYFQETQDAYVDSLNVLIPSQTIELGQLKLGPTFNGRFETDSGLIYSPYFGIDAIYNIGNTSGVTVTDPSSPSTEGWRARLQAGVDFTTEGGTQISFGGTYDGLGRDDFEVWGLSFDVRIPLKKARAR